MAQRGRTVQSSRRTAALSSCQSAVGLVGSVASQCRCWTLLVFSESGEGRERAWQPPQVCRVGAERASVPAVPRRPARRTLRRGSLRLCHPSTLNEWLHERPRNDDSRASRPNSHPPLLLRPTGTAHSKPCSPVSRPNNSRSTCPHARSTAPDGAHFSRPRRRMRSSTPCEHRMRSKLCGLRLALGLSLSPLEDGQRSRDSSRPAVATRPQENGGREERTARRTSDRGMPRSARRHERTVLRSRSHSAG